MTGRDKYEQADIRHDENKIAKAVGGCAYCGSRVRVDYYVDDHTTICYRCFCESQKEAK